MKRILFSLVFAFSLQSLAVETQTTPAINSTPAFEEPHWSFLIGSSFIKLAPTVKGNGLTIGAKYNFIPLIGLGAAYTNFKTENEAYNLEGSLVLANTYADITPIQYRYNNTKITGGLQLGFASTNFTNNKNESGFYYGATAGMNIENQIGFSYDMKVSKNFNIVNTLSMIGYY